MLGRILEALCRVYTNTGIVYRQQTLIPCVDGEEEEGLGTCFFMLKHEFVALHIFHQGEKLSIKACNKATRCV